MTRSTVAPTLDAPGTDSADLKAGIIADFQASLGGLKCIGSERLLRLGISLTQLHILNLVESHGEMAMSRVADMLDVSLSNATGLIDRVEERGFIERIRVPSDRRMVMVRLTPAGRKTLAEVELMREEALLPVLDGLGEEQLAGIALAMTAFRQGVAAEVETSRSTHTHDHQRKD